MSKLTDLNNIFTDLDSSYLKLKSSFNVKNKQGFLKKLCFDSSGTSIIPKLKLILKEESSSYTLTDREVYTDLVLCLDSIDSYLKTIDLEDEIVSLNSLMFSAIISKKNESSEKIITRESLIERFIFTDLVEELNSKSMFKKYGELKSFCKMYRKKIVRCRLVEDFSKDFFIISSESIQGFSKEIGTNKSIFFRKVLNVMGLLKEYNFEVPPVLVFVSEELLEGNLILGRKVTKIDNYTKLNVYKFKSSVIVVV